MQLNTILIDDEKNAREILKNYLGKYCPNINIIGQGKNINEALELTKKNKIDLVFLDVEMPYGNAFDFIDKLKEPEFEIVFVTAYDHYAINALNSHAAYYLTKPISIDNLIKAVDYVTMVKEKENALQDKILVPKTPSIQGKISIPTQNGFEIIAVKDIIYAKADDNYTQLFFEDHSKKLVSKTLKYFEDALTKSGFVRIHKSHLVNINCIVKYNKGKGGSIILNNNIELTVSASKKANLLSYFK